MSERDFEIGSRKFKLNKIDAFKQFHITRRLAPLLGELAPVMGSIAQSAKNSDLLSETEKLEQFAKLAAPVMNGLSKLSDQDADRVLYGLLSAVEIQQAAGNWARVATDSALMMQDLELPVLLQCAGRAFMFNLSGFFQGLPQK